MFAVLVLRKVLWPVEADDAGGAEDSTALTVVGCCAFLSATWNRVPMRSANSAPKTIEQRMKMKRRWKT